MAKLDSKNDLSLKEAEHFFQQGNFVQALKCYRQLDLKLNQSDDFIAQRIRICLKQLLRKYWRQEKVDQMAQMMKELDVEQELALCYARLRGKEALAEVAAKTGGIQAKLAQCSLQEDLKSSLLSLRQIPELKAIAEGWLILLKGDNERAFASFDQAKEQAPVYAKIGKGVAYLIKGDMQQANTYLESLRPFASRYFPVLAKEMGWGEDLSEEKKRKLPFYLFSASLEELKHAESLLSPQQADIKGWMWLRIGDYLVSKSVNEALSAWNKAKKFNPKLALDELKRRFLLSYQVDCSIKPNEAFQAFYRKLVELTPQDAKEFVEYSIFDSQDSLSFLEVTDLKRDKKWIINPPPIELQLLWFHVFYQNNTRRVLQLLFLTPEFKKHHIQSTWEEWALIFQVLDVQYGKRENYLRQKLEVARLYEQGALVCSIIVQLLQLNAMLKDELLPIYVQIALPKLLAKSTTKNEKQEIGKEIDSLRHFWFSDYDLIRLSILANDSDQSPMDLVAIAAIHLSEPLRQVLQFQVAIDQGWGVTRCLKFLPDKALYQRDREADWRLLIALFHPTQKFPRRELEHLLSLFASTSSSKHELFSKVELYGGVVPLSILKNWQKGKKGWESYYHLALYYRFKEDFDKSLSILEKAYHLIPEEAKERTLVEKTLEHYLGDSMFGGIPPDVVLQWLEELLNQ